MSLLWAALTKANGHAIGSLLEHSAAIATGLVDAFAVSVGYVQGVPFSLHRSLSLSSNNWIKIPARSQSNNFIVTLTDTNAADVQNFYRVSAPAR
ncbi:MAG TPA: hypothetical protein VNU68_17620 [Verrucomicrobiae bacterium]|nr:hypothetical protein [Verrucomicrobiae bacterium]